ncbi:STN domain-containing protein [Bradyrhizobium sp. Arg237L]|uniref:STN domain-containing protein n=1 Tax=Bradyrhizobium sp. Arg237L TaxID=3003352 RepID=UPI00249EA213|nr:STN domain-containing protein [Bradyrhizobium sp. Arg237L]MDI4231964.1 STN domain-containing protein [Bradyrhizobium sp. Arg237L]
MMRVFLLLNSAMLAISLASPAHAAEGFVDFNIPVAPLDRALEAFGRISKEQLLLDASIADGRLSKAVVGKFTPEAALRQMLSGSGLTVRAVDGQGFAIVPAAIAASSTAQQEAHSSSAHRFESYSATIQTALGRALCGRADTMPGAYRTMARLWIGIGGTVGRSRIADLLGRCGP